MPLVAYLALRIFAYFFQPDSFVNNLIAGVILVAVIYLLSKKDPPDQKVVRASELGWLIIAAEIMLGGAGNFLSIAGIALRTWFLVFSLAIYFLQNLKNLKQLFSDNRKVAYLLGLLYLFVGIAFARGYFFGHSSKEIISDTIPYLFFLYYFPLKELLTSEKFKQTALNLLIAAIVGNLIFVLFTFVLYSGNLFNLQDSYYHWFRDVANGKITGYDFNYYRIFLNEQLLLVPLLLWLVNKTIKKTEKIYLFLSLCLLVILSVNITRIYILALAVGLLFLFNKTNWKRWLICSVCTLLLFFSSFTIIHTLASRGQSLGWEFFGLRLQSIAMPQIEDSSLSRMMLLPKILDRIKTHPILGNGSGDTVTVFSPIDKKNITTPQFDWGYLEIWDELGLLGLAAWLGLIVYCFMLNTKNKAFVAALVALLVINITSPALFHVLGVLWISILLAM